MFAGVAVVMFLTTVANAGETLPALKSTATKSQIQAALLTYADRSYQWRKSALAIYQRLAAYQDSHDGKILSTDLRDMHRMANLCRFQGSSDSRGVLACDQRDSLSTAVRERGLDRLNYEKRGRGI